MTKRKDAAVKISEMILESYFKVHKSIDIARENYDEVERKAYCRAAGKVLGYMLDLLEPIYREHPDLEPEWIKAEEKKEKAP
jgi:hypothetical protein